MSPALTSWAISIFLKKYWPALPPPPPWRWRGSAVLGSDIAELLGKKTLAKGVHIQMTDETVTAEPPILVAYGHTIPEVGKAVQDAVKTAVESMTGLEIAAVNVNVGGITFPAAAKA